MKKFITIILLLFTVQLAKAQNNCDRFLKGNNSNSGGKAIPEDPCGMIANADGNDKSYFECLCQLQKDYDARKKEKKIEQAKESLNKNKKEKNKTDKNSNSISYSDLSQADKEKLKKIALQRRSSYQKMQDNFDYTNQITNNLINTLNHYAEQERKNKEAARRNAQIAKAKQERREALIKKMELRQRKLYSKERQRILSLSNLLFDYIDDVANLNNVLPLAIKNNIDKVYFSYLEIKAIGLDDFHYGYWKGDIHPNLDKEASKAAIDLTYHVNPSVINLTPKVKTSKEAILNHFKMLNCDECFGENYSKRGVIVAGFDPTSVKNALVQFSEMLNSPYAKGDVKRYKKFKDISDERLDDIKKSNYRKEKKTSTIASFSNKLKNETFSVTTSNIEFQINYNHKDNLARLFISKGRYVIIYETRGLKKYKGALFNYKNFYTSKIPKTDEVGTLFNMPKYKLLSGLKLSIFQPNFTNYSNRFIQKRPNDSHYLALSKNYFSTIGYHKIKNKWKGVTSNHVLLTSDWIDWTRQFTYYLEHGRIQEKDGIILLEPNAGVTCRPAIELKGTFFDRKIISKGKYQNVWKKEGFNYGYYPYHSKYFTNSTRIGNNTSHYDVTKTRIQVSQLKDLKQDEGVVIRAVNQKNQSFKLEPAKNVQDFNTLYGCVN